MDSKNIIVLGADHAGYEIKEFIKEQLTNLGYALEDIGTDSTAMKSSSSYKICAAFISILYC